MVRFDAAWLFDQYVNKQRPLPEIAVEANVSVSTIARWAAAHGIPLRGRGGASHTAALAAKTMSARAPEVLRPALATAGGWKRLHRFALVVKYPTLTIAAKHLGVHQSVLALQISRIESELGSQLLVRAERGHPMKRTEVGEGYERHRESANPSLATSCQRRLPPPN